MSRRIDAVHVGFWLVLSLDCAQVEHPGLRSRQVFDGEIQVDLLRHRDF